MTINKSTLRRIRIAFGVTLAATPVLILLTYSIAQNLTGEPLVRYAAGFAVTILLIAAVVAFTALCLWLVFGA